MFNKTKAIAKGGIATAAVGAMALAGATPAFASDRDHDGISVGDVIAGAVIIGGIAAVANAASRDRGGYEYREGRYYGRDGYRGYDRYGYRGNPRGAIERCVNAARYEAQRYGYRHAQVTDIRDVDDTRYGWRVEGKLRVDNGYSGGRYDRYGYYDRYNRYSRWSDSDSGRFSCAVERGRVVDVDLDGIRGSRW